MLTPLRPFALLGLLFCLSSYTALAADPWYEIEIIVFEPNEPVATSEKWPLLFEPPSLDNATELAKASNRPSDRTPVAFQELAPSQLQLLGEAKRLTAGKKYQVILHTAWRQPLSENGPGTPVHITSPAKSQFQAPVPFQNSIDGTITVILTRYLHLKPNLVYTNPDVDLSRQIIAGESNAPSIQHFVMKESRRVKLQELHYFDHPYFGMIARVVRFETPKEVN